MSENKAQKDAFCKVFSESFSCFRNLLKISSASKNANHG